MDNTSKLDPVLLFLVLLFTAFGMVMVTSASVPVGMHYFNDSFYFVKRHLISVSLGIVLFWIALRTPLSRWRSCLPILYILTLIALSLVFVPGIGIERHGAHRWIQLKAFQFQPSELAKLVLILYFASILSRGRVSNFTQLRKVLLLPGLLLMLILAEPDFSTTMLLSALTFIMLFIGGTPFKLLAKLLLAALFVSSFLIFSSGYRAKRLIGFLSPNQHRKTINYQTHQSLLAIGSGEIIGEGLGKGKQKFLYLPQPHTDFIFSVIAEELGFVGATALLSLFLLFTIRSLYLLYFLEDSFAQYTASGFSIFILLQAFLHIVVTLQLGPATGVPLPFISYGGSSTIVTLLSSAILLQSLTNRKKKRTLRRDEKSTDSFRRDRRTYFSRALP